MADDEVAVAPAEESLTTPLLEPATSPRDPSVEVRLYRRGAGPAKVFRSVLRGPRRDRLDVRGIQTEHGLQALFARRQGRCALPLPKSTLLRPPLPQLWPPKSFLPAGVWREEKGRAGVWSPTVLRGVATSSFLVNSELGSDDLRPQGDDWRMRMAADGKSGGNHLAPCTDQETMEIESGRQGGVGSAGQHRRRRPFSAPSGRQCVPVRDAHEDLDLHHGILPSSTPWRAVAASSFRLHGLRPQGRKRWSPRARAMGAAAPSHALPYCIQPRELDSGVSGHE